MMKYGPLSYYRLGQAFPRSESREFYRDHRKIRLIVATAPVRIPIHWATTGVAQGLGDGSSEANRIELKKAMENDSSLRQALVAGDTINCKDDGDLIYDGTAGPFATLAVGGTANNRIMLRGYNITPGDGGIITIEDSDNGVTNHSIVFNSKSYWHFLNITLIDPRFGFHMGTTFGHIFMKCMVRADGPTAVDVNSWVQGAAVGDSSIWIQCVSNFTAGGFQCEGRGNKFINCFAGFCLTHGFNHIPVIHPGSFHNCVAWGNAGSGFQTSSGICVNCIGANNGQSGFHFLSPEPIALVNCISAANAVGITSSGSIIDPIEVLAVNCNLNPSDKSNSVGASNSTVRLQEINQVVGDLLWEDELNIDITPKDGSSLIESAVGFHPFVETLPGAEILDFGTVGAIQRQDTVLAGINQGIFRYYTGLLPVTKMEDLT